MAAESSSSSSTPIDSPQIKEEALALYKEGLRAKEAKQWAQAVDIISKAVQKLESVVGPKDPQLAPLLFDYGSCLLENYIVNSDIFGSKAAAEAEDEAAAEREEHDAGFADSVPIFDDVAEDDMDAAADQSETPQPNGKAEAQSNGKAEAQSNGKSEAVEEDKTEDKTEGDGKTDDDLQLAFEILDASRVLFEMQEGREAEIQLARCYLRLGDAGNELELFEQATGDYQKALALKQKLFPEDDRGIAGVHADLACAALNAKNIEAAVEHYRQATQLFRKLLFQAFQQEGLQANITIPLDSEGVFDVSSQFAVSAADKIVAFLGTSQLSADRPVMEMKDFYSELWARLQELETSWKEEQKSIDEAKQLMGAMFGAASGFSSSSAASSSASDASGSGQSQIGFGSSSGASSASSAPVVTHVPQVKRKATASASATPSATNGLAAAPASGSSEPEPDLKKHKLQNGSSSSKAEAQ